MEITVTHTKPDAIACRGYVGSINETLSVMGSKWAVFVIVALVAGPRRFSDLKREIPAVSQKMLTQTLRDLERDGLVQRHVTPIIPPRVEYQLTAMGEEICAPIQAIAIWADRNNARVAEARKHFDGIN